MRTGGADRIVAIVSDGAGSAARSREGSQILCDELSAWLMQCLDGEPDCALGAIDPNVVRDWVERGIDAVRFKLTEVWRTEGGSLADFHATLVAVIADNTGGVIVHIGDGVGFAATANDLTSYALSPAENGEYANETFFYTEEHWREHLRLTTFGPDFDLIALMTDGVMPVALAKGGLSPFPPFFTPVSRYLESVAQEAARSALVELLSRESMRTITGDDKTLVWIKRAADV